MSESATGFLVSPRAYRNFEMNLDFMPDETVNSGILIGCKDPNSINLDNCYEINIWDDHPNQEFRTGAIVLHGSPPLTQIESKTKWNSYRITFHDKRIIVWLNEQLTAETISAEPRSGFVALQSIGGKVQFRNLKIKRIKK